MQSFKIFYIVCQSIDYDGEHNWLFDYYYLFDVKF